MKVYVASSWSNGELLDEVHAALKARGFETLDFRAQGRWWKGPADQGSEVADAEVDPFYGRIYSTEGIKAFEFDFGLMHEADCAFVVHPCGLAVALETGFFVGQGKAVIVWGREVRKPLDITWAMAEAVRGELVLNEDLDFAIECLAELVGLHEWSKDGSHCLRCGLRREFEKGRPICRSIPESECPKCGAEQDDFDGFGVLSCPACGWCSHASITDGVCSLCGKRPKEVRP